MNWLRKKLRKWLGVEQNESGIKYNETGIVYNKSGIKTLDRLYSDLTSIGVDVHFKSPHMILIFTKLKGGQIYHIDADFKDLKEVMELVKGLKERWRPKEVYWDAPPAFKQSFKNITQEKNR